MFVSEAAYIVEGRAINFAHKHEYTTLTYKTLIGFRYGLNMYHVLNK